VDDTVVGNFSESGDVAGQYETIDISSYGFSGTCTIVFKAIIEGTTGLFTVYLDEIKDFGPGTSGDAPLTVQFQDLSAKMEDTTNTSWAWDFQNDGTIDSTEQNPLFTYTTNGSYTVKLTATNANGSDTEIKAGYINVGAVTPPEFISFTVTDYNGDGIKFGSLDPGQSDRPADGQPSQGAVTITVGTETNVDVDVKVMGTDFTVSGNTIAVGNVKYNDENDSGGATALTTSYVTWYSVSASPSPDHVTQVYYWITIPPVQPAGDYTSTFSYKAEKASP
jgi:PKD repeat protein